jgi:integrase
MGLGALHTVSLSSARDVANECRQQVRDGIDPIERRNTLKLSEREESAKVLTFEQCAIAYIEAHKDSWKNAKHASQWQNTLMQYAYPVFGSLPVQSVDIGLVLNVIEPIWKTKTETASRVRARIENILDWATVRGYRQGENPARWRGHLDKTLPKRSKVQKVNHHPALPYEDVAVFMKVLKSRTDMSARLLEFIILTVARTNEAIGAKWSEIDIDNRTWTVPAERMKPGTVHKVPLSEAALSVLSEIPIISGTDYVFPGRKPNRPVSNMTCLKLLARMGYGNITVHGFRSTFREWAEELSLLSDAVAEQAMSHTNKNKVEAAYQRRDLFDKRRQLMNDWADYTNSDISSQVQITSIRMDGNNT